MPVALGHLNPPRIAPARAPCVKVRARATQNEKADLEVYHKCAAVPCQCSITSIAEGPEQYPGQVPSVLHSSATYPTGHTGEMIYIILHSTVLYYTTLYLPLLWCNMLDYTLLRYTMPYSSLLYSNCIGRSGDAALHLKRQNIRYHAIFTLKWEVWRVSPLGCNLHLLIIYIYIHIL